MKDNIKANEIVISACVISYNQEAYIKQALESVLSQEYPFPYEVVIGDDCSTDNTLRIINELILSYTGDIKIRVLNRTKNLGMHKNWLDTINACRGKYIALIEGDDFWNDKLKLAMQIAVLEKEPEVSICFSDANVINEIDDGKNYKTYLEEAQINKEYFDLVDLLNFNFIPTCTAVFRNGHMNEIPNSYYDGPYADWFVHLTNAKHGKIKCIHEAMSTYRLHGNGVFGNTSEAQRHERWLKCYELFESFLNEKPLRTILKKKKKEQLNKLIALYKRDNNYVSYLKAHSKKARLKLE